MAIYKYKNISFDLTQHTRAITFQILSMNEELLGDQEDRINATCVQVDNINVLIMSGTYPYIRWDNTEEMVDISLRAANPGDLIENHIVSTIYFETNFKRDEMYKIILSALKLWDDNGWNDEISKNVTIETKLENFSNAFSLHIEDSYCIPQNRFQFALYKNKYKNILEYTFNTDDEELAKQVYSDFVEFYTTNIHSDIIFKDITNLDYVDQSSLDTLARVKAIMHSKYND